MDTLLVHQFQLVTSLDLLTSANPAFSWNKLKMDRMKHTDPYQEIFLIAVEIHQTSEGMFFLDYMKTIHSEFHQVIALKVLKWVYHTFLQ